MLHYVLCFLVGLILQCQAAIYTYEDIELRRIFPSEFPQDVVQRSGSIHPEQLARYAELKSYFDSPKSKLNAHFEELACYQLDGKKICKIDMERYRPQEDTFYLQGTESRATDRRRVYCFMLICFNEDELDRVTASFLNK